MTWRYNRAQEVFLMIGQMRESIVGKITLTAVLLLGIYLVGCGNVYRAEVQAQTERG
jgi:hypothetical protein